MHIACLFNEPIRDLDPDAAGYMNQYGLSHKVCCPAYSPHIYMLNMLLAHLWVCQAQLGMTILMFCNVSPVTNVYTHIVILSVGHWFDPNTPISETMGSIVQVLQTITNESLQMQALHNIVKAGYMQYIGMLLCYAYQCMSPWPLQPQFQPPMRSM